MADFNMNNVLSGDELDDDFDQEPPVEEPQQDDNTAPTDDEDDWGDDLDVGGEVSQDDSGSIYANLAKACVEDGIFGDSESAGKVTDAASFRQLMDNEIGARLDSVHRRVMAALGAGAPEDDVRQLEDMVADLNSYDDSKIADESDEGVNNRKELIYKAALANGMSEERARKEVDKSFKAGTDIEDARESLAGLRRTVSDSYTRMVEQSRKQQEEMRQKQEQSRQALEKEIMTGQGYTGNLSEQMRRRIVNNSMVPSERTPDGKPCTPLQKFCMYDPSATRILGELFTVTDGFRNLGVLADSKVRKGVSRGLASMERKLQNSTPTPHGGLRYAGGDAGEGDSDRYELEI